MEMATLDLGLRSTRDVGERVVAAPGEPLDVLEHTSAPLRAGQRTRR